MEGDTGLSQGGEAYTDSITARSCYAWKTISIVIWISCDYQKYYILTNSPYVIVFAVRFWSCIFLAFIILKILGEKKASWITDVTIAFLVQTCLWNSGGIFHYAFTGIFLQWNGGEVPSLAGSAHHIWLCQSVGWVTSGSTWGYLLKRRTHWKGGNCSRYFAVMRRGYHDEMIT